VECQPQIQIETVPATNAFRTFAEVAMKNETPARERMGIIRWDRRQRIAKIKISPNNPGMSMKTKELQKGSSHHIENALVTSCYG
jgi:hypothetical protein